VATPGTSLYRDLLKAREVKFELDPGSGLGDACIDDEGVPYADEPSNIVHAVLENCSITTKWRTLRGSPQEQVAFFIGWPDSNRAPCKRPGNDNR
jgi:hypothetical protein